MTVLMVVVMVVMMVVCAGDAAVTTVVAVPPPRFALPCQHDKCQDRTCCLLQPGTTTTDVDDGDVGVGDVDDGDSRDSRVRVLVRGNSRNLLEKFEDPCDLLERPTGWSPVR